jgi:hypothetical protein
VGENLGGEDDNNDVIDVDNDNKDEEKNDPTGVPQ